MLHGLEKGSTNEELENAQLFAALIMPNAVQNLGVIRAFVSTILSWLCTPLEMFLRFEHGERTLSVLRVFNSFLALQVFWFVSSGVTYALRQVVRSSSLAGMVDIPQTGIGVPAGFQAAFLLASAFHLWRISYRRRKNVRIHSFSAGLSVIEAVGFLDWVNRLLKRWKIPFEMTRWTLYLYIEPLIGALAAYCLQTLDPITSLWLWIASVSLWLRNSLMAAQQRHILLDYYDSILDSEFIRAAANQAPPKETAGIMVLPGFAEAFAHAEELNVSKRVQDTFES